MILGSREEGTMDGAHITRHARDRLQQRGISPFVIDLLLDFGDVEYDHHGAEIRYFGKRSKRRVARHIGRLVSRFDGMWNAYIVTAEGRVLTAGHRTERVTRN